MLSHCMYGNWYVSRLWTYFISVDKKNGFLFNFHLFFSPHVSWTHNLQTDSLSCFRPLVFYFVYVYQVLYDAVTIIFGFAHDRNLMKNILINLVIFMWTDLKMIFNVFIFWASGVSLLLSSWNWKLLARWNHVLDFQEQKYIPIWVGVFRRNHMLILLIFGALSHWGASYNDMFMLWSMGLVLFAVL